MAERRINPTLKAVLEWGPVIGFFAGFMLLKADHYTVMGREMTPFILLTALFVPVLLITTGLLWALSGVLSRMQVFTVVIVLVMGGLSVWLNDERFFKMKPTILYLAFAGILGVGLLRGQSYLSYLMGEILPLTADGWLILTRRMAGFFALLAIANEVIWRNFSTGTWVSFKTFGLTAALFLFFVAQNGVLSKHMIEKDKAED